VFFIQIQQCSLMDVFISYNWSNKEDVLKIKNELSYEGITVWIDDEQIKGGDWLYEDIVKGIHNSKIIICFLSPDYINSKNCGIEVSLSGDYKKPIIPVIVKKLAVYPPVNKMGAFMAGILYVDFTDASQFNNKIQSLIKSIKSKLIEIKASEGNNTHPNPNAIQQVAQNNIPPNLIPAQMPQEKSDKIQDNNWQLFYGIASFVVLLVATTLGVYSTINV